MERVYKDLVSRVSEIYKFQKNDKCASNRVIIALSGPPGSGKSTIAKAVARRLNSQTAKPLATTLPMDGFYHPKAFLNSLPNREGMPRCTLDLRRSGGTAIGQNPPSQQDKRTKRNLLRAAI